MNTPHHMTGLGWIFMIVCWGAVFSLAGFCFTKMLRKKKKK